MSNRTFIPALKSTYSTLRAEYEKWQYAANRPVEADGMIDDLITAMHSVQRVIERLEDEQE